MKPPRLSLALAVILSLPLAWATGGAAKRPVVAQETRATDPVCNLRVARDPDLSFEYEGEVYYFCMNKDLESFRKDPEKYLTAGEHTHPEPADD